LNKYQHNGIVYLAQSPQAHKQLEKGLSISRSYMRNLPIHLISNDPNFKNPNVNSIDYSNISLNAEALLMSPFQKTLFLDATRMVVEDVHNLFDILERFDIAIPYKRGDIKQTNSLLPLFEEKVILYSNKPKVKKFLEQWKAIHSNNKDAIQKLLVESSLRFFILAPEYNIYNKNYLQIWTEEEVRPKIIDLSIMDTIEVAKLKNENKSFYQQLRSTKHKLQRIWHELKYSV